VRWSSGDDLSMIFRLLVPDRGVFVDKDEGVPTWCADDRMAFVDGQSHSFIGGATVRMVAWAFWSEANLSLHKWGNHLIPYC
jgi:hypothetical protein